MNWDINTWQRGDRFSASHLNEPLGIIRSLAGLLGDQVNVVSHPFGTSVANPRLREYPPIRRMGIVDASTFSDDRYLIYFARPNNGPQDDTTDLVDDPPAQVDGAYVADYPVSARNTSEMLTHTHTVPDAQPVEVYGYRDHSDPSVIHWYFTHGGTGGGSTLLYGLQQGAWTPGSNSVTIKPCNSESDATPTGAANVTAYISCPISGTCTLYAGASGDILVCQKLKGGSYLIISPKITPTVQPYQPLQGDPTGTYFVVDYVHGL